MTVGSCVSDNTLRYIVLSPVASINQTMLLTQRPTLQNDLVRVRPLVPADREPLYLIARDRLLWEQHQCPDRHERHVFDKFFDDGVLSMKAFTIEDRASGRVIGSTRIRELTDGVTEIGWTYLDRSLWGTDYNKSMKDLLIGYIFEQGKDVLFYVNQCNVRSQKAVGKLGAKQILDADHPLFAKEEDGMSFILHRPV